MPNDRRIHPSRAQVLGFAIYVPSTLLALAMSLSGVQGYRFLIILLCLPAIFVGMLLMVLGAGGDHRPS